MLGKSARRRARRLKIRAVSVSMMCLLLLVGVVPSAQADPPDIPPTAGNHDLKAPKDSGNEIEPLTDEMRLPVPADAPPPNSQILTPDPEVKVPPGQSVKDFLAELDLAPRASGPNFDAYADAAGIVRARLVYPVEVNHQIPDGTWEPLASAWHVEPMGWKADLAGGSVHLPSALGPDGVSLQAGTGSLILQPVGVTGAQGGASAQGVTYPQVFTGADVSFSSTAAGVTQKITVANKNQVPDISWNLQQDGITAQLQSTGEISLLDPEGSVVGSLSPPVVQDAGGSPQATTASYSLTGSTLSLSTDISKAKFPAVISMVARFSSASSADTYVDEAAPNTSFETRPQMLLGSGRAAFVHFDLSTLPPMTQISTALLGLKSTQGHQKLNLQADTGAWPTLGSFTWLTQPTVDPPTIASGLPDSNGTYSLDLTERYNQVLATGGEDLGVKLTPAAPGPQTTLASSEAGVDNVTLLVVANAVPNAPSATYPQDGDTVFNPSPTLRAAKIPRDTDGEKVYLKFQIQETSGVKSFAPNKIVTESDWIDAKAYTLTSGALLDGHTYDMRILSWDKQSPTGKNYGNLKSSSVETFSYQLRHLGNDSRYGMWSQKLGNDMELGVNQANGNLYLSVPLDALVTPTDTVAMGMTYNSQGTQDNGLGRGWDIYAGPGSSFSELPSYLQEIQHRTTQGDQTNKEAGVKIVYQDGSEHFFGYLDHNNYAGNGIVHENPDGSFTLTTSEGGEYAFQKTGLQRGLVKARPAYTSVKSTTGETTFDYDFDSANPPRITKLTDSLGRKILFCWNEHSQPGCGVVLGEDGIDGTIVTIKVWDGRRFPITGSGGSLTINDPLTVPDPLATSHFPTPAPRTIVAGSPAFTNGAKNNGKAGNGFVTSVTDGSGGTWRINYSYNEITSDKTKSDFARVSQVIPPAAKTSSSQRDYFSQQVDPGLSTQGFWGFKYFGLNIGMFRGTTANRTQITDPNFLLSGTRNTTDVYFNSLGFPQLIKGPQDQDGKWSYRTFTFDDEDQLVCERSVAANAVALSTNPKDCLDPVLRDPYWTLYDYEQKSGRMKRVTGPRPLPSEFTGDPGQRRVVTETDYDGGLEGLWATYYDDPNFAGISASQGLLTENFNDDNIPTPPHVTGDWGARFSGYLKVEHADTYGFRFKSEDGGSVSVGHAGIASCTDGNNHNFQLWNCGNGEGGHGEIISTFLSKGDKHLFTAEMQHINDNPKLQIQWAARTGPNPDNWDWNNLKVTDFSPNRGLVTRVTVGARVDYEDMEGTSRTVSTYDNDEDRQRSTPTTVTQKDLTDVGDQTDRTTSYEYDDYGRIKKKFIPGPGDRFVQLTYDDTPSGGQTDYSCVATLRDQTGLVTNNVCDPAGQVIRSQTNIARVTYPDATGPVSSFSEFPVPTAAAKPTGITTGPDGNIYFTEFDGNAIGRITPDGDISEFAIPGPTREPYGITTGPDERIWFGMRTPNALGALDLSTGEITEYPLGADAIEPFGLISGPGDKVWFVTDNACRPIGLRHCQLGNIDPSTGEVELISMPLARTRPKDLAVGPDGNLWIPENGRPGGMLKFDVLTGDFTEYEVPPGDAGPFEIELGPDGYLWFTESEYPTIGRMDVNGNVTEYAVSSPASGIASGPGNMVSATLPGANKIAQIDTSTGEVTEYQIPTASSDPFGIVSLGQDVWFTERESNRIGVYHPATQTPPATIPRQGLQQRITSTCFDPLGRTVVSDPPGSGLAINVYDGAGRILSVSTPVEGVQKVTAAGIERKVNCANIDTRTSSGRQAIANQVLTGARLVQADNVYDARGELIRSTGQDPGFGQTRPVFNFTYDAAGYQISADDGAGNITRTAHDALGRTIAVLSPENREMTTRYRLVMPSGSYAQATIATDPAGVTTITKFDVLGRTSSTQTGRLSTNVDQLAAGAMGESEFEYDVNSNLIKTTQHAVGTTKNATTDIVARTNYDGFNEPIEQISPVMLDGVLTASHSSTDYDLAGRVKQIQGPGPSGVAGAHIIDFTYDTGDRMKTVSMPGVGMAGETKTAKTTVEYDQAGERTLVQTLMNDDQTQTRAWTYDIAGRVKTATAYAATVDGEVKDVTARMNYNAAGWLTRVDQPDGFVATNTYDDLGRLHTRSFVGNGYDASCPDCTVTNTYFANGSLETTSHGMTSATLSYNADNQLTDVATASVYSPAGLGQTSYTYSPAVTVADPIRGNLLRSTGQLTQMSTAAGITDYTYTGFNQLKTVHDPFSAPGALTAYTYDCLGRVIQRGGTAATACIADAASAPSMGDDAGGMNWRRSYESGTGAVSSQVISTVAGKDAEFALTYDASGNIKTRTELVADPSTPTLTDTTDGSGKWTYEYDDLNRLTQADLAESNMNQVPSGDTRSTTYDYDLAGNRTQVDVQHGATQTTRTMTYDAAGLPVTEDSSAGGHTSYAYDETGHLVAVDATPAPGSGGSMTEGDRCYTYDGFSNMVAADTDSAVACDAADGDIRFAYDSLGRTALRHLGGTILTYAYQGIGEDLARVQGDLTGPTSYVSTPMGNLAQDGPDGTSYFMKDLHGDVVGLSAGGTQSLGQLYSPYGEPLEPSGTGSTDLGFQGDYTDPDTGLVDMGARLYDPNLARFATQDTVLGDLANPATLNQFGYGNGNPVTMSDPTGMAACGGYTACSRAEYQEQWALVNAYNDAMAAYDTRVEEWEAQKFAYENFVFAAPMSSFPNRGAYASAYDRAREALNPGPKPQYHGPKRPAIMYPTFDEHHADLELRYEGRAGADAEAEVVTDEHCFDNPGAWECTGKRWAMEAEVAGAARFDCGSSYGEIFAGVSCYHYTPKGDDVAGLAQAAGPFIFIYEDQIDECTVAAELTHVYQWRTNPSFQADYTDEEDAGATAGPEDGKELVSFEAEMYDVIDRCHEVGPAQALGELVAGEL